MQSSNSFTAPFDASDDTSNPLFQPAEISRMTRNLRSKLAHASIKAQLSPETRSSSGDARRRTKTMEGANTSPRPAETPTNHHYRTNSRRSSINNLSPVSSMSPNNSLLAGAALTSPHASISRINSVTNLSESPFHPPPANKFVVSPNNRPPPASLTTPRSYAPQLMVTPQSVSNQPITNQPITNQPMTNQPMTNQPMTNQPMINQPMMNPLAHNSTVTPQRIPHPSMLTPPDSYQQKQQRELQALQNQFQREYQEKVQHFSQNSPPHYPKFEIFDEPMDSANDDLTDLTSHPSRLQQAFSIPDCIERIPKDSQTDTIDIDANQAAKPLVNSSELRVDTRASGEKLPPGFPPEPATPPPLRRMIPQTPERRSDPSTSDGASLLLHFAQSPGRGTPRTPDFNMSDYLQFQTPSPARNQLTPHRARWGSLNSTLFSAPNGPALAPPAMPDPGRITNTANAVSNH